MYLGAPGVIIKEKPILPEQVSYDFVTSIIVDTDRGPIDTPVIINSLEEYNYHFGETYNKSRRYVLSFLQYSKSLMVMRSVEDTPSGNGSTDPGTYNASSTSETTPYTRLRVDNLDQFNSIHTEDFLNNNKVRVIARTPGTLGNEIKVAIFNIDQYRNNVLVYTRQISGNINDINVVNNYYAKDLTDEFDESSYCVAIFRNEIPIEVFIVPYDNVEKINEYSNEIYIAMYYEEGYNISLYDGDIQFFDGNFGYYDGNVFNTLQMSYSFYGNSILTLSGGESLEPVNALIETAKELSNYDIDIHIAYNIPLEKENCVNIVSTPKGVKQAKDFIEVYNTLHKTPKMYIYGIKKLDSKEMGLEADYAGLRSRTVLNEGLGVSSSKVLVPFNILRLVTNLKTSEINDLYYNKINPVCNYKGSIFCNGELISY